MPNDVKLQEGHPVDENLRPLKVGGKSTAIETAQHGNGARINGDCEITGSIPTVTTNSIKSESSSNGIKIDSGKEINLDSLGGLFKASQNGVEFSATDSAYAGMILGYTRLQGDLTSQGSFEIQDDLTVEDNTHQVAFKTPPSELVEIEATFHINFVSTSTIIHVGLSDQGLPAGYQSVGVEHEYDAGGHPFSDGEAADGVYKV